MTAQENHYRQKLENKFKHFALRWIVIGWTTIIIVNVTALSVVWYVLGSGLGKQEEVMISPVMPQVLESEPQQPDCPSQGVCAPTCQELFNAALATLAAQPKSKLMTTVTLAKSGETFVPLGSTRGKNFAWVDTGMQAYLDPVNYSGAKAIYFEASMSIPTANGKVFLRLVQTNENVVMPGSEIWSETDKIRMVTSSPITLMPGNKLYKVQLKTSMDFEAIVDSARLRIVW